MGRIAFLKKRDSFWTSTVDQLNIHHELNLPINACRYECARLVARRVARRVLQARPFYQLFWRPYVQRASELDLKLDPSIYVVLTDYDVIYKLGKGGNLYKKLKGNGYTGYCESYLTFVTNDARHFRISLDKEMIKGLLAVDIARGTSFVEFMRHSRRVIDDFDHSLVLELEELYE